MATLTSYDGSVDDTFNFGSTTTVYIGQGFQVQANATCTGISIKGSRGVSYTGGSITIGVYTGKTKTGAVYTENTTASFLPTYSASPPFTDFTFASSFSLTKDTQYYLIITVNSGNGNDEMRWSGDTTSPTYSYGNSIFGGSDGTSDQNFKIYGTTSSGTPTDSQAFGPGI
jgi:hypothetical protein